VLCRRGNGSGKRLGQAAGYTHGSEEETKPGRQKWPEGQRHEKPRVIEGLQCPVMAAAGRSCQGKGRPEEALASRSSQPWTMAMAAWLMDLPRHLPPRTKSLLGHSFAFGSVRLSVPARYFDSSTAAQAPCTLAAVKNGGVGLPPRLLESSSSLASHAHCSTSHEDHRGCGLRPRRPALLLTRCCDVPGRCMSTEQQLSRALGQWRAVRGYAGVGA
jgi:hypothetical protein